MQVRSSFKTRHIENSELSSKKKVDINILLNKVKIEKKKAIKKNFIITSVAIIFLTITGLISFL